MAETVPAIELLYPDLNLSSTPHRFHASGVRLRLSDLGCGRGVSLMLACRVCMQMRSNRPSRKVRTENARRSDIHMLHVVHARGPVGVN